jgi:membrane protease YdiL (CAAX protease family)
MISTKQDFIRLAVIVIVFYLGLTYLPQMLGTCMDGVCGFSLGEILISFAIPLAFIALPIMLEMLWYRKGLAQALSDIGITRVGGKGIRIALAYMVPLLLFFPVISLLANSPIAIRSNAVWLVINIILVNGFAEEILMRGYVFRHLREGRSFWRAATYATLFFAA